MLSYGFGCTAPDPPLEDWYNRTIGLKYSCNRTVSGARRWVQISSHQTGSRQTARHVRVTTRPTRPVRRPVASSSLARLSPAHWQGPIAPPLVRSRPPLTLRSRGAPYNSRSAGSAVCLAPTPRRATPPIRLRWRHRRPLGPCLVLPRDRWPTGPRPSIPPSAWPPVGGELPDGGGAPS